MPIPTQFAPTTAIQLPNWAQQNQQQQNPYIQGVQNQVGMPQGWLQQGTQAGPQLQQAPQPPAMQGGYNPMQQQANQYAQQLGMGAANTLTGGAAGQINNWLTQQGNNAVGSVANGLGVAIPGSGNLGDAAAGGMSGTGASSPSDLCCWIITYGNGGYLPWFVRPLRDIAYARSPKVAKGYTKMADWLVPLMHRYQFIDKLVQDVMVKPLTEHCGWIQSVKGCRSRISYQKFWWFIWSHI